MICYYFPLVQLCGKSQLNLLKLYDYIMQHLTAEEKDCHDNNDTQIYVHISFMRKWTVPCLHDRSKTAQSTIRNKCMDF